MRREKIIHLIRLLMLSTKRERKAINEHNQLRDVSPVTAPDNNVILRTRHAYLSSLVL